MFRGTREILDDLKSLIPKSLPAAAGSGKAVVSDAELAPARPKVRVLGCPAHDEADEIALHMFRQLLDATQYETEVMSNAALTSEVVALVGETNPSLMIIASVSLGGLAQTRYLCKRLRARFPGLKIAVGYWGMGSEDSNNILLAGADRVGTTLIETRGQMMQLCPVHSYAEAQPVTTGPALFPEQGAVLAAGAAVENPA